MTENTIAKNKRGLFDYEITEHFEAGIALTGGEIKSIRAKRADISAAYARVLRGEVWLINMNLSLNGLENPTRTRKLLLHKSEINRLIGLVEQKGYALIPLYLYFKRGKAKIDIGVGRGRKKYDKRELIKKRDIAKEQRQVTSLKKV
ncbi:MAG: SsrA-binding protein SmpB [Patescibacteria group bacterium]|jgi:SsrA-binding protein